MFWEFQTTAQVQQSYINMMSKCSTQTSEEAAEIAHIPMGTEILKHDVPGWV